jgi:hypothetical protein
VCFHSYTLLSTSRLYSRLALDAVEGPRTTEKFPLPPSTIRHIADLMRLYRVSCRTAYPSTNPTILMVPTLGDGKSSAMRNWRPFYIQTCAAHGENHIERLTISGSSRSSLLFRRLGSKWSDRLPCSWQRRGSKVSLSRFETSGWTANYSANCFPF